MSGNDDTSVDVKLMEAKTSDPKFYELTQGYVYNGEWIDMSRPWQCKKAIREQGDNYDWKTIKLGDKKERGLDGTHNFPVEFRGLTIRQLRAVDTITRRYAEEEKMIDENGTRLDYEEVSLYEINTHIIKPFTKVSKKSLVESLPSTAGTQPPEWFAIHWWGESFRCTMNCIEQFMKDFEDPDREDLRDEYGLNGGGITLDTPIWICAFANRQNDLVNDDAITVDPSKSGFAKAMRIAQYRTISILDEKSVVFSRIGCTFELYLTLVLAKDESNETNFDGMWATYTSHPHVYWGEEERHAVGIISCGMTTSDNGSASLSSAREEHFPLDRIISALTIDVENADASVANDKIHILNYIQDPYASDFNKAPTVNHPNYDKLNRVVRGAFLSSIPALQYALNKGDEDWHLALKIMCNSIKTCTMSFDFRLGWDKLTKEKAVELIRHLPVTIRGLEIFFAPYGEEFVKGIVEFVATATNLKRLNIRFTFAGGLKGGRDCGMGLAKALEKHPSIKELTLFGTDLIGQRNASDWEKALQTNKSLKKLECYGVAYRFFTANLSTLDDDASTVEVSDSEISAKVYWNDDTAPDATLTENQEEEIKAASSAAEVEFFGMTGDIETCE